jgi:hypothetical protein
MDVKANIDPLPMVEALLQTPYPPPGQMELLQQASRDFLVEAPRQGAEFTEAVVSVKESAGQEQRKQARTEPAVVRDLQNPLKRRVLWCQAARRTDKVTLENITDTNPMDPACHPDLPQATREGSQGETVSRADTVS